MIFVPVVVQKEERCLTRCWCPKKKYFGKYVALRSFSDNTVVASGTDPEAVMSRAKSKKAVILFVPEKALACVY